MVNKIDVRELFNNNEKAINLFLEWCNKSEEICDFDFENLCVALGLGSLNTATELIHFHKGNVLDWLEEQGYYIEIKPVIRYDYKYLSGVYHKSGYTFFITYPYKRDEAIIKGIQKAIEHLEKRF